MLTKHRLTFLENPASGDELKIAEVMNKYFTALKTHNLALLLSLFDQEARIDSQAAGGIVSIDKYKTAMEKVLPTMEGVYICDLLIRVENATQAKVYGTSRYSSQNRSGRWWRRMWIFSKKNENGDWKIIESFYLPF